MQKSFSHSSALFLEPLARIMILLLLLPVASSFQRAFPRADGRLFPPKKPLGFQRGFRKGTKILYKIQLSATAKHRTFKQMPSSFQFQHLLPNILSNIKFLWLVKQKAWSIPKTYFCVLRSIPKNDSQKHTLQQLLLPSISQTYPILHDQPPQVSPVTSEKMLRTQIEKHTIDPLNNKRTTKKQ